jgi:hypothetical protein
MSASPARPSLLARQPLSALDKVTIGALLAGAAGHAYLQILIGVFVLPIVILVIGFLLVAGLVASGWRWGPVAARDRALGAPGEGAGRSSGCREG